MSTLPPAGDSAMTAAHNNGGDLEILMGNKRGHVEKNDHEAWKKILHHIKNAWPELDDLHITKKKLRMLQKGVHTAGVAVPANHHRYFLDYFVSVLKLCKRFGLDNNTPALAKLAETSVMVAQRLGDFVTRSDQAAVKETGDGCDGEAEQSAEDGTNRYKGGKDEQENGASGGEEDQGDGHMSDEEGI